eukprot:CAMPEP_0198303026 /NCGR_PEP_ID=MMETSP1449-20131203/56676_1 /TAXON_ID=420275 /ORGANISM="Attheya septentrionalis, Strain CCMP2084" /LENGTH=471 /DNA_ID=CAMNT_0044005507 /DNA_START=21 /DNA_END=1436 /DNA_ORIENTATION=-
MSGTEAVPRRVAEAYNDEFSRSRRMAKTLGCLGVFLIAVVFIIGDEFDGANHMSKPAVKSALRSPQQSQDTSHAVADEEDDDLADEDVDYAIHDAVGNMKLAEEEEVEVNQSMLQQAVEVATDGVKFALGSLFGNSDDVTEEDMEGVATEVATQLTEEVEEEFQREANAIMDKKGKDLEDDISADKATLKTNKALVADVTELEQFASGDMREEIDDAAIELSGRIKAIAQKIEAQVISKKLNKKVKIVEGKLRKEDIKDKKDVTNKETPAEKPEKKSNNESKKVKSEKKSEPKQKEKDERKESEKPEKKSKKESKKVIKSEKKSEPKQKEKDERKETSNVGDKDENSSKNSDQDDSTSERKDKDNTNDESDEDEDEKSSSGDDVDGDEDEEDGDKDEHEDDSTSEEDAEEESDEEEEDDKSSSGNNDEDEDEDDSTSEEDADGESDEEEEDDKSSSGDDVDDDDDDYEKEE